MPAGHEEPDASPDAELSQLLRTFPTARVSALTVDGTPIPVPTEVRLGEGHVLSGTDGMKGYDPADRSQLINAFDEARRTGHGRATARALRGRDSHLSIHIFDTSEQYGAYVVVGVPDAAGKVREATVSPIHTVSPSRLARVYKSRTAMILGIDRATSEILGWSAEDMVGKRSLEFIHPDDQGLAIESWAVLMTEPDAARRVRLRHRSADGGWIWFDVAHSPSSLAGEECLVADMVDLTVEMQAQSALEAREQLLAQLAQALPLGVFQVDAFERIIYTNDRLFAVMGTAETRTLEELLQWVTPADVTELTAALHAVMEDGGEREVEVHVGSPDDSAIRVCQFTLRQLASSAVAGHGVVGCVADITERTLLRRELEDRATYDTLTRCYNRVAVMSKLDAALEQGNADTAVLFIDLDLFKSVNDRFGHLVGDEFLAATASRLRHCVRESASVGRVGGDEFLVVLPRLTAAEVDAVAQRVSAALSQDMRLSVGTVTASASVGVALSTGTTDAEALVKEADAAMYQAKRGTTSQAS